MATRVTMEGLEFDPTPAPLARTSRWSRSGPGEFTILAVLWAGFGLYALSQGFRDDRAPLVIVGATSIAVLVVGVAWPVIAMRSLRIRIVAPTDATVGRPVRIRAEVTGHVRGLQIRLVDPPSGWANTNAPDSGEIALTAVHRGVYAGCRIEAKSSGPLNVFTRHRWMVKRFDTPMYVGPQIIATMPSLQPIAALDDLTVTGAHGFAAESVRSVRPYVVGDSVRAVHWPSSARSGDLVVREFEPPTVLGLAIVVDLRGGDAQSVEAAASRAAGMARSVVARGGRCLLVTREATGIVSAIAESPRMIDRRLAAAVVGDPGGAPGGWPVEVVQPRLEHVPASGLWSSAGTGSGPKMESNAARSVGWVVEPSLDTWSTR